MTIEQQFKEMVKLLRANVGRRGLYEVFTDFVAVYALALRNSVSRFIPGDEDGFADREAQFERIKAQYEDSEIDRFTQAFAHLVDVMTRDPQDVLGRLYMQLEISDAALGQFYTPYEIARLMAGIQMSEMKGKLDTEPFITVHEPACGAGAMLIAIASEAHQAGINYQERMHVTCEDLSLVAVHMVYIHLSLLHVPAIVHRRNTLTLETFFTWPTPAHVLGGWDWRLSLRAASTEAKTVMAELPEPTVQLPADWDDVFKEVAGADA